MRLGAGLRLATPDSARWQQVVTEGRPTGVAVRLEEAAARIGLGLAFLGGRKVVDVSADPASFVSCLHESADAVHEPRTRWADALTVGLRRAGEERGWWNALPAQLGSELTAAAAAWPLLRPAIEAGHQESSVPRWARSLVSAPDLATGTRALLGDRASRQVIREMADALSGPVRWWPIGCAVAIEHLDANRIATLLAESAATHQCTPDDRLLLGRTLSATPPNLVHRLLRSADDDDGPARLLVALDGWHRITGRRPQMPNRLDRLEAAVAAELEVPPPPRLRPQPPQRRRQAPPERDRVREPRQPREPVEIDDPVRPVVRHRRRNARAPRAHHQPVAPAPAPGIDYAEPWRSLHRAHRGEIELVLPHDGEVLTQWALALDNCLHAYANAVEAQRSIVIGIRRNGRLIGAVEISPETRRIHQIEGGGNRALPAAAYNDVLMLLAAHGIRLY